MNPTAVYLGNLIKEFKNHSVKEQMKKEDFVANSFRLSSKHEYKLKVIAKYHGVSFNSLIRIILDDFLTKREAYKKIRAKLK